MKKKYLEAGKIVNVHGIKGEVKVMPWCDGPEMLCEMDKLYLDGGRKEIFIEKARTFKNMVIMKIEGTDSIEQAEKLRNTILYINRDEIELDEHSYFIQDLIGIKVYDADSGKYYGKIEDVLQTGANDVYSIKGEGRTYLVPAIADVVIETDIDGAIMKIRPLKGLFDDEN